MTRIPFLIFIFFLCVTLSACERREAVRHYTEVVSDAAVPENDWTKMHRDSDDAVSDPHSGFTQEQLQAMLAETVQQTGKPETVESRIVWSVPESWDEKPAKGMRMASFVNQTDPSAIDCSIVTLGSGAGGLAPNVVRWLQQIHLPVPSEAELNQFIEKQEKFKIFGEVPVVLLDFTTLPSEAYPSAQSMIAAIIDLPNERIFVKMTGTKEKLLENVKAFRALVQSIKLKT